MKKIIYSILFILVSQTVFSQTLDGPFSQRKMRKDLKVFKAIREEANSGLYTYRSKAEIDSIYNWAFKEINNLSTYSHFYNLICTLTDFEGSLHNDTYFPKKLKEAIKNEKHGYFPYPVKIIENKLVLNTNTNEIPIGSEIVTINDNNIDEIIPAFYKYYTTDGINKTGKQIGINKHFSKYYRFNYGLQDTFLVTFKAPNTNIIKSITLSSVGYSTYYDNFKVRHSHPFDRLAFENPKPNEVYTYKKSDNQTGILTINSFSIGGNEKSVEHKIYKKFLDSVFVEIKKNKIKSLIVDVRNNGGGTDPNDVITYSYLTSRNFQESKQVWVSFKKIPFIKYFNSNIPKILRPLGVSKYNKLFQKRFPIEKNGKYFIRNGTNELKVRTPNENAFNGHVYLLISPRVASAGSLFAALVVGNENTITIGEETMGGYYGHNGHTSFEYVLPKSKIVTMFSIDNIKQDVPKKENQFYNRGIIPDHNVPQTFNDFLNNTDNQLNYTFELIKKEK